MSVPLEKVTTGHECLEIMEKSCNFFGLKKVIKNKLLKKLWKSCKGFPHIGCIFLHGIGEKKNKSLLWHKRRTSKYT